MRIIIALSRSSLVLGLTAKTDEMLKLLEEAFDK